MTDYTFRLRAPVGDNEPDEVNGQRGFWCQGDCAFILADHATQACNIYRRDLSDARIGISSHNPDGVRLKVVQQQAPTVIRGRYPSAAEVEAARVDGVSRWLISGDGLPLFLLKLTGTMPEYPGVASLVCRPIGPDGEPLHLDVETP